MYVCLCVYVCVYLSVCACVSTTKCGVDRCSVSFSHSCCTRFLSRLFINILRDRSSSSPTSSASLSLLLLLPAVVVVVVVAFNVPFDYFDISNCCRCSFYGPVDRPLSLAPHSIWKHDLLLCKFDDSVIPHNTLYNLRRRRRLAPKKICLQGAFLIQKSPENFTW